MLLITLQPFIFTFCLQSYLTRFILCCSFSSQKLGERTPNVLQMTRKRRVWVITCGASLLRLRRKQVLLPDQMLRVSIHQSYLLSPAQFAVLNYLTRKPLPSYRNLSILDFLGNQGALFKCTEGDHTSLKPSPTIFRYNLDPNALRCP